MTDILYIITGTSRGIGRKLEEILEEKNVDFLSINRQDADLSDIKQVVNFLESTRNFLNHSYPFHKIVFINNASNLGNPAPLGETSPKEITAAINTNFIAPVLFFNFLATLNNKWLLVNMTSGAANTENKYLGIYSTTKLAVEKYIKFIELEETNCVGVYNYNPQVVLTDMNKALRDNKFFKNEKFDNIVPKDAKITADEIWNFLQEINKDD